MKFLLRLISLYVSLFMTWLDKLLRKLVTKRIAAADGLDKFIEANGLTATSLPGDIDAVLHKHFIWRSDKSYFGFSLDYAKCPEAFLNDGQDDCDGFAMFSEALLKRLGHVEVTRVYIMADNSQGHVICTWRLNGITYCVGNWNCFPFTSDALVDIGKTVSIKMAGSLSFAFRFTGSSYLDYVAA